MPVKKIRAFLDSNNVKYVIIKHSPAYTAQEIAASAHVSGKELAKTVMVKINGKMTMAVLPATYKVDFNLLKKASGADKVKLAREEESKLAQETTTAELLSAKQTSEATLLAEKQTREDELRTEGREYKEAQTIANREYEEAQAASVALEKESAEADEATVLQKAMDSVTALADQYGGLNFVPKIQLLPYVDTVEGLEDYLDPKRVVGKAGDVTDVGGMSTEETSQMARDLIFDNGDVVGARKILRDSGISKSGVNTAIRTINKDRDKIKNATEVLNRVDDVINLPDEAFGVAGQAKDWLSGLMGSVGMGGKPSVFENKMANITVDYATEKLKGVLSDQDMNRVQKIVGDAGILRKGPEEARQILGEVQEILERSIEQRRTGKMIKRTQTGGDDVFGELQKPGDTIDLGDGITMTLKAN